MLSEEPGQPFNHPPYLRVEGVVVGVAAKVKLYHVPNPVPHRPKPRCHELFEREERLTPNDIKKEAGVDLETDLPD